MSDKTHGDEANIGRKEDVAPEKSLDGPINHHLKTSNTTTTVNDEGTTSEFDVWWNAPENEDPANPRNWSNSQKWTIIASLSLVTFLTYVTL